MLNLVYMLYEKPGPDPTPPRLQIYLVDSNEFEDALARLSEQFLEARYLGQIKGEITRYRFGGCIRPSTTTGNPFLLTEITGEPLTVQHQYSGEEVEGIDFLTEVYFQEIQGVPSMDAFP